MKTSEHVRVWTKELVQEHAQAAAAVELYTLPFYITAMASIRDRDSEACKIIFSVAAEEMLHLQLAANLCIALDAAPNFRPPQYGADVPCLKPYDPETGERGFLNAVLGPFNDETLNTMLDIETPEEVRLRRTVDHTIPQHPYNSIGEMYDALMVGIKQVGIDSFSWKSGNQQKRWSDQNFPQIITSYSDARSAVQAVTNQGEGHIFGDTLELPPWTEKNFPIPPYYRLMNDPHDPEPYNGYAHFGRFIKLKNSPMPSIYVGEDNPEDPVNRPLQQNFFQLLMMLETLWMNGGCNFGGGDVLWHGVAGIMKQLVSNARSCWKAGVIPNWFCLSSIMDAHNVSD